VGTDGFLIGYKPTLKKVVNDRRASLDPEADIKPAIEHLVRTEFDRGRTIPWTAFPEDGSAIPDTPKLTLAVLDPGVEFSNDKALRARLADWTTNRGGSRRLYPASLAWCLKKPGRELTEKTESLLAWRRVKQEVDSGTLQGDFDRLERAELVARVRDAEGAAADEVWASYRYVVLADGKEPDGLRVIDLGAGHSSSGETLCGRVIQSLKNESLLNESVGAGYIERNWPPALKGSGAWPLSGLRQSFLNGALTRLMDPDAVLKGKICDFVAKGDFGLASGQRPDGTYDRVWFEELMGPEEVGFDASVFLLSKAIARKFKATPAPAPEPVPAPEQTTIPEPALAPGSSKATLRIQGTIPPELWNRLGTRILPKLKSGEQLRVGVEFSVTVDASSVRGFLEEISQLLEELGVSDKVSARLE
jgi:hypothetical protein